MNNYFVLYKDGKVVDFFSERDDRVKEIGGKIYEKEIDKVDTVDLEGLRKALAGKPFEKYLEEFLTNTERVTNQTLDHIEPHVKAAKDVTVNAFNNMKTVVSTYYASLMELRKATDEAKSPTPIPEDAAEEWPVDEDEDKVDDDEEQDSI